MSWDRLIARRGWLRGAGATLALPLLPSLARAAQPTAAPRLRFVALCSPNGQQRATFWPAGEPQWTVMDAANHVREVPLRDLPGPAISTVIGPELSAHRDKLLLVRGLDFVPFDRYGHYPTATLSGWARFGQYHPTLDQVLAASKAFYPERPRFPTVNAVVPDPVPAGDPISVAQVAGVPSPVRGVHSPAQLFRSVFEDDSPSATESPERLARRVLILDGVREQYQLLMGSARIGADDRRRLEAHATFVHDLQKRLVLPRVDVAACAAGLAPEDVLIEEVNLPQLVDDHLDVLAAILKCGLSRVATLQLGQTQEARTFPFVDAGPFTLGHHQMTHELGGVFDAQLGALNAWYGTRVARFLDLLDEVEDPETGATYLDRSVVYWGNEFGCNPVHSANAMPVLLAGGAGGQLRTGRYLDYRRHGLRATVTADDVDASYPDDGGVLDWRGRPYNELLVTLLQVMGLLPADYETAGEPGFGDYSNNRLGMYLLGDRRAPLPAMRA